MHSTSTVGERGTVVIPAQLRRKFKLEKGSLVIAEATADGVLLRPARVIPLTASEIDADVEDRHDAGVLRGRAAEKGKRGIPWQRVKDEHGL